MSAPMLESWDRCRRLWQFQEHWHPIKVTPLGSVYQALREVVEMPVQAYTGPQMARERVMELAGERGVQTGQANPYDVMLHHAHLAEVLARLLRQPQQDRLERFTHPNRQYDYLPESYLIDGGVRLMRFVLADHWDDNRLQAELHSWRTIGDVCVTGLPMGLRVFVIGNSLSGKRYGHFTRAKQHPYDKSVRFARRQHKGQGFSDTWLTVWRENTQVAAEPWIAQMARDGVLVECCHEVKVRVPGKLQRDRVLDDIARIAEEMERSKRETGMFPMTRSACDMTGRGPCLYQCICYAPADITPGESGLFRLKEGK